MESRSSPRAFADPAAAAPPTRATGAATEAAAASWPLVAMLFAATSIILGLIWDIS